MDQSQLKELIAKINQGKASDDELAAYNAYMNRIAPGDKNWDEPTMGQPEMIKQELWEMLSENMNLDKPAKAVKLWPRIAAAASVIMALSLGTYFILHKRANQSLAGIQKQDIEPGGNKAIIKRGNAQPFT